ARDGYADNAQDFLRDLKSFQAKVGRYNAMEKEFDAARQEYNKQKDVDPAKAEAASRRGDLILVDRFELAHALERGVGKLKGESHNRLELNYGAAVERVEGQLQPLAFALTSSMVEATVAARSKGEKSAVAFDFVYRPLLELPESSWDGNFKRIKPG